MIADQQWKTVQEEDTQNKQSCSSLSRQILTLTKEVRSGADPGFQTVLVARLGPTPQVRSRSDGSARYARMSPSHSTGLDEKRRFAAPARIEWERDGSRRGKLKGHRRL